MYVVSVIVCVGVAVVQLLQISPARCYFINSSTDTQITSDILHHNESTSFSLQDNIISPEIAPINFAGQMTNNNSDTLYNNTITNSSIQDFNNSHTIALNNFTGQMDDKLVTKSANSSQCPSCTCGKNNQRRRKRIVGGEVAERNEFPWMVALIRDRFSEGSQYICGAIVITKQHLLTAAHCVFRISPEKLTALFGKHNLEQNETHELVRNIEEIIMYPKFNAFTLINDIAILKLDRPIPFNTSQIQPACLPQFDIENQNYTGFILTASGWGIIRKDWVWNPWNTSMSPSPELRKVELSIADCGWLKYSYIDDIICTYTEGKDTCNGDSGGPLHISGDRPGTMKVIGITSGGGFGCARPGNPGCYTRIGIFMEWVNKTVDGECLCIE